MLNIKCLTIENDEFSSVQGRKLMGYWKAIIPAELLDLSSLHTLPFSVPLLLWKKRKAREQALLSEYNRVTTMQDMWSNLIFKGYTAMRAEKTKDQVGMESVRSMMQLCLQLAKHNAMLLEPFQLETVRACVLSSARRILGHHLDKYKHEILKEIGVIDDDFTEMVQSPENDKTTQNSNVQVNSLFNGYAKRFVAVVAPRRNGKSKAGKLFVAVNAVCEEGARIVLIAHSLNAILLYKNELIILLQQIQDISHGSISYKVHSSATEISLEFSSPRPNSYIYFVAGGINVSSIYRPYLYAFYYDCFAFFFIPFNLYPCHWYFIMIFNCMYCICMWEFFLDCQT